MPEALVVKRVVLADDHPILMIALSSLLHTSKKYKFEVVAKAYNGEEALHAVRAFLPDLLILDLNMPQLDGLSVLDRLGSKWSNLHICVLSAYDDCKIVRQAFRKGADGYVLKQSSPSDILKAFEDVVEGNTVLGQGVALPGQVNGHTVHHAHISSSNCFADAFIRRQKLTKRELEVLRLISQAMSNKEIAKKLYISDQTVSVHRKNIMRKLGVTNTAGLLKAAYENALI